MADEFQESDVILSDHHRYSEMVTSLAKSNNYRKKKMESSVPVKIPENIFRCRSVTDVFGEEEHDFEEKEPPHLIVDRRLAAKMAFSVCTGNGRTLKGRDLSQVRNSILRMTGFLET